MGLNKQPMVSPIPTARQTNAATGYGPIGSIQKGLQQTALAGIAFKRDLPNFANRLIQGSPIIPQINLPRVNQQFNMQNATTMLPRLAYNYGVAPIAESFLNLPRTTVTVGKNALGYGIKKATNTPYTNQEVLGNLAAPSLNLALTAKTFQQPAKIAVGVSNLAENASKTTLVKAFLQGFKNVAPYGFGFGFSDALQKNQNQKSWVDQVFQSGIEALPSTIAMGVMGGAISSGSYLYGKLIDNTAEKIGTVKPNASLEQLKQDAKGFWHNQLGRWSGKPKEELSYYGDLRESYGLPRDGSVPIGMTIQEVGKPPKGVGEIPKNPIMEKVGITTPAEPMGRNVSEPAVLTTKAVTQRENIPQMPSPIGGGQGNIPTNPSLPGNIPQTDEGLITKLTQALREAKPLRGAQEKLYTLARGKKLAGVLGARKNIPGEAGYHAELGVLKGELPKVQYEAIRQQFDQPSVNRLFDIIRQHKGLGDWEKLPAESGLAKILGQKGGGVPTRDEIEKLNTVFGKDFTEALLSKRSTFQKLGEAGMQVYNLSRSMMAGVGDLSATLMQNLLFAYRHPIMTAKNLGRELKMFGSENYFRASGEEIASRSTYDLMKKAKISLTDVGPIVNQREEQFMASWAEKIPGLGKLIHATGRAYTGFLNRMRADVFDQLVQSQKNLDQAVDDPEFLKWAGKFVNAGTGRGGLGPLEKSASLLSQGLFSARKLAATVQMVDPRMYITAPKAVRQEALKTVLSFIAGGTAITQLAKLSGAEVGDDPTSADFGKIKIGNTRFNVWGSYQQMAVLMARLWKGYGTSSTTGKKFTLNEGYKPVTRLDLISRFFESKEHPTLSLILSALRGQNQIGQPFDLPVEVLNRFIPMVLSDGYDLYQEHGSQGLLGLIPAILGIPTQTYGDQIPTIESTEAGNPSVRLKPIPGLAEDIIGKATSTPISNIPEPQWPSFIKAKEQETNLGILKEQMKGGGKVSGNPKTTSYTIDGTEYQGYELGGKFVYTDEDGNIVSKAVKTIEKAQLSDKKGIFEAQYSLTSDRLKREEDYANWSDLTQKYVDYLTDFKTKLDPTKDAKELITTQNKIEDLQAQLDKYKGYGGFKKGKKITIKKSTIKPIKIKKSTIKAKALPKLKLTKSKKLKTLASTTKTEKKYKFAAKAPIRIQKYA
jgi:hypothetical protein